MLGSTTGTGLPPRVGDALVRTAAGSGGLVVVDARDVLPDTEAIVAAAVSHALDRSWNVVCERARELDRARPLALTRRLIATMGAAPAPLFIASEAAAALDAAVASFAAEAEAEAALLVIQDAQRASRACLRVLGQMGPALARRPALVLVTVGARKHATAPLAPDRLRGAAPDVLGVLVAD